MISSKIIADDSSTMMVMAAAGAGLTYGTNAAVKPLIAAGHLRQLQAEWATGGRDKNIHYPSLRHMPTNLRSLIELIREVRPQACLTK